MVVIKRPNATMGIVGALMKKALRLTALVRSLVIQTVTVVWYCLNFLKVGMVNSLTISFVKKRGNDFTN